MLIKSVKKNKKTIRVQLEDKELENLVNCFSFVLDVIESNAKTFSLYFLSDFNITEDILSVNINNVEEDVSVLLMENLESIVMMWKLGANKATIQ